jgi:hypothetical protein
MIGDPSGKSSERQLLDAATIEKNLEGISQNSAATGVLVTPVAPSGFVYPCLHCSLPAFSISWGRIFFESK